ncbi:MAG: sodium:proton antiporter, partial [Candidatus Methylomirabilis sp.]|nr:sodium:proton antiporter [Deltaproteobacteria bacterium]
MGKVGLYSILLIVGLVGSQALPALAPDLAASLAWPVRILTTICLGYIMIGVGMEFDIDKSNLRRYGWDYIVAATAAAFPWIFCAIYFVFAMTPSGAWGDGEVWKESLLVSRFAAPTSAGILFSMLAAAGLAATWTFRKARVLAIFDDLDTVLLMIPLKMMMVGVRWELGVVVLVMIVQLWIAWRLLHRLALPTSWAWLLGYAAAIVAVSELIYLATKGFDGVPPIHIEVLLPAFVLGTIIKLPPGHDQADVAHGDHGLGAGEHRANDVVSALFMVLVGLSMPPLVGGEANVGSTPLGGAWPGWGWIAAHVLLITVVSNLGKMFSVFCYRKEASPRERLAVSIGMWPRGEVGAGVLVVSLSYGVGGPAVTVAVLSLALNLALTGAFIW